MKAILITGTPGTGKTTVSRILAERLRATHIDLTKFVREGNLIAERDEARDTDIIDIAAAKRAVAEAIRGGDGYVILDGHYSPELVERASAARVIVLRRAPWLLMEDLKKRGYSPGKVRENAESELIGVCLSEALSAQDADKICELDTSNKAPKETAEEIMDVINAKAKCSFGQIDWMERPEAEDLIRRLE